MNDYILRTLINTEVLKPCPFCGKNVGLISDSNIRKFIFTHASRKDCPFLRDRNVLELCVITYRSKRVMEQEV